MSRSIIYVLACTFTLGLFASSCSKDDKPDYTKEIVGTYAGDLIIDIPLFELSDTTGKDVKIESAGNSSIHFKLDAFTLTLPVVGSTPLGDIHINDVPIEKIDETTTVIKSKTETIILADEVTRVDVTVNGNIVGSNISLDIKVTNAPVANTVNATFKGTRK